MNYRIGGLVLTLSSLWRLCDGTLSTAQPEVDVCFATYLQSTNSAASAYSVSYEECFQKRRKLSRVTGKKHTERDEVEAASGLVCNRLADCNALEDEIEFFQCHDAIGQPNLQSLLSVKFISSVALVDLEQQHEVAEKEVLLCTIEAQRKYAEDTTEAYRVLSLCLRGKSGEEVLSVWFI